MFIIAKKKFDEAAAGFFFPRDFFMVQAKKCISALLRRTLVLKSLY